MIVGLTGRKRAGKSTAARYLVENHGFTELSFAEPLKRMALAVDPVVTFRGGSVATYAVTLSEVVEDVGWEAAKDHFPEVRRFLQRLGTEGVRDHIGQDTWVDLAELRVIQGLREDPDARIVFADVRFENEAALIRQWGGVVVKVHRSSQGDPEPEHASEAGVTADRVAMNPEGHLSVLFGVLDYLVTKVVGEK